jgi:hypothetical protein
MWLPEKGRHTGLPLPKIGFLGKKRLKPLLQTMGGWLWFVT